MRTGTPDLVDSGKLVCGILALVARHHPFEGESRKTLRKPDHSLRSRSIFSFVLLSEASFLRSPKEKPHQLGWRGFLVLCGGGGIRTHDTRKRMPVFKTGAFNQALPPLLNTSNRRAQEHVPKSVAFCFEVIFPRSEAPNVRCPRNSVHEEIVKMALFDKNVGVTTPPNPLPHHKSFRTAQFARITPTCL